MKGFFKEASTNHIKHVTNSCLRFIVGNNQMSQSNSPEQPEHLGQRRSMHYSRGCRVHHGAQVQGVLPLLGRDLVLNLIYVGVTRVGIPLQTK